MTWLGVTANYGAHEHRTMRHLRAAGASRDELAVIHLLVGLFDARFDKREQRLSLRSERAA